MASHEYYSGGQPQQQQHPYATTPSPAPYYQQGIHSPPPSQSTPAPPYQAVSSPSPSSIYPPSNYPSNAADQPSAYAHPHNAYAPDRAPNQSPFASVFDDNAYPMHDNTHQPHGDPSSGDIGQQHGFYQDTTYHGGGSAYDRPPNSHDDIPMQDQPGKDVDMNDHIYDAPGRSRKKSKRGKVRLGQLGMMGSDKKRIPWVVYTFTIIQIAVFIGEIVKNGILTGSPIMIHPQFNPMIGPSTQVLINMGGRYAPCMHNVWGIQNEKTQKVGFLCPNATNTDAGSQCPLSEVCGFSGMKVPEPKYNGDIKQTPIPNQWFRFIVPIFLHAGLIHIGFNLLMQMTIGREMEQAIGSIRFFLVYMSAGIFGFVMGGNYAAPLIVSTGCSGSLFGIIALTLLDLLYSWKDRRSPVKDLMFVFLDMIISFVLGLLPGLDNYSHIGGFLTGIAVGISVLHSPNALRRRMGDGLSYATVSETTGETPPPFHRNPMGFFKGRKPLWWAWWLVRAAMLILIIVVFIVLLQKFYVFPNGKECSWCKYLSCIPVNNWCELGTIKDA